MLIRIVRLELKPENVETFRNIFWETHPNIEGFPGCLSVRLLEDAYESNVLSTWSHWEDDIALQDYRQSDLFNATWRRVKPLFKEKAVAHSYFEVDNKTR